MNVETEFTVSAPRDRVFQELAQLDAFASVVPGSSMRRLEGEAGFEGPLRLRVGGSERDCVGTLRQIDVDEDGRRTSCWFRVRDARGPAFATGLIRGRVTDANGSAHIALSLEGRLAALGTDETQLGDEAEALLGSLAQSLETSLAESASRPAPSPAISEPPAVAPSGAGSARAKVAVPLVGAGILAGLVALRFRRRGRRSRWPW